MRIAHADQLFLGHDHKGIGTLDPANGLHQIIAAPVESRLRHEVQDDFAVHRGLEYGSTGFELVAQLGGIGQVSIVAEGDTEAKMQVDKTDTGFVFGKSDQRDVNFDWIEYGDTGAFWLRVSPLPYRQEAGPGGNFGIMGFVTPIDEENCRVFFWRTRKVSGWQRDVWKFMWSQKSLRHLIAGAVLTTLVGYAGVTWLPSFLILSHEVPPIKVADYLAWLIGGGLFCAASIALVLEPSRTNALRNFLASLLHLAALLGGLFLERMIGTVG